MAAARSTSRAKAWKWSIAGGSVAAFLVMAQTFHIGDASPLSTPSAASAGVTAAQAAGGFTVVCVEGAYGYTCSPAGPYGGGYSGTYGGASAATYGGAFANTRSSGS